MKRYIIVDVVERLPNASDQYYTNQGLLDFNPKNGNFWDDTDTFELYPNWWLEEVEETLTEGGNTIINTKEFMKLKEEHLEMSELLKAYFYSRRRT